MVRQGRNLSKLMGHGSKKKLAFSNGVPTKRSVSSGSALFTLGKFLVLQCKKQFYFYMNQDLVHLGNGC